MKAEWVTYLNSVGITGLYLERAEKIIEYYTSIFPATGAIQDIFVSEKMGESGTRQYNGLWLLGEGVCMEAHNFLGPIDHFDWTRSSSIQYWAMKKKDYPNPDEPTAESRCSLKVIFSFSTYGDLEASGTNCKKLHEILSRYFIAAP